eukprot:gnl/Spiro4/16894_TR9104_c0_g1_i1.p1 gnl/Spiro4/16894_TR9104_c0_g1~~gnl/Spiro4/16894_TR9104_c0_g1_i1.p1  ORF type:complete len:570 (+),score=78.07 gnl/Spiro4/16894_TR9104_c0_g1_i1:45-1712(+)
MFNGNGEAATSPTAPITLSPLTRIQDERPRHIRLTKQIALEKLQNLELFLSDEHAKKELRSVIDMIMNQKLDDVEFSPSISQEDTNLHSFLEAQLTNRRVGDNYRRPGSTTATPLRVAESPARAGLLSHYLTQMDKWDFDVFHLEQLTNGRPLTEAFCYVCEEFKFFDTFELCPKLLREWCFEIETSYKHNPYHNSTHAADVLHGCYWFALGLLRIYPLFPRLDLLSLMLAAVIHDTDHPGVNNAYLSNTLSELSILYNDRSILENHHVSEAFRLAVKLQAFANLSSGQFSRLRKTVVEMVLATDMSQHVAIVSQFEARLKNENFVLFDDTPEAASNMQLLLNFILKCADISNPTRPLGLSKQWSARITCEFFAQGDREKLRNIPVSQFMDRNTSNIRGTQIGFINYVVAPAFALLASVVPGVREECLVCMEQVLAYWQSCAEAGQFADLFGETEDELTARVRRSVAPATSLDDLFKPLNSSADPSEPTAGCLPHGPPRHQPIFNLSSLPSRPVTRRTYPQLPPHEEGVASSTLTSPGRSALLKAGSLVSLVPKH